MKKTKTISILLVIFLLMVLSIKLYMSYVFVTPIHVSLDKKFGIIDGCLYKEHDNVEQSYLNKDTDVSCEQHGDCVLEFLQNAAPDVSLYYYDAEMNGKIATNNIIKGLEWMIDSHIDCVTISLSSKHYSAKLEDWISEHANKIKIYASYNNTLNSFDYPAQYAGVIGVGAMDVLNSKKDDVLYKTYDIVVLSSGMKQYNGNSYLTPYTMIKNNGF